MYKSKAVDFLKTLSKDEIKRFGDFVSSPYYNKNSNVVKLYDQIKGFSPDFLAPGVAKEKLFTKMFPGKPYNEQVMKNLSSQMLKLAKEFLCAEHYNDNYNEKSVNLLRQLSSKKLDTIFSSEFKTIEKELKDLKNLSDPMFFYLYRLELEKINFMLSRDRQQMVPESILKQGEYLIFFFLVQMSIALNNIKINEDSFNAKFDVNLVEEFLRNTDLIQIMDYIKKHDLEFGAIVDIHYHKMMCSLNQENEENYYRLKELYKEYLGVLQDAELYNIFTTLESFCVLKLNADNREYYKELFEVYNIAIDTNILHAKNPKHITAMKFRNVFTCALRMKEYDWARNFVERYRPYLTDESDSIANLAHAQLYFAEKKYDEAIEMLNRINSDLHFVKLDVRTLTIKIYYEQDYLESAISSLNTFRQFLKNNEHIVPSTQKKILNFINIVTNLIRQKANPDPVKLKELRNKADKNIISSRKWLIEKIDEIGPLKKKPAKSA